MVVATNRSVRLRHPLSNGIIHYPTFGLYGDLAIGLDSCARASVIDESDDGIPFRVGSHPIDAIVGV